MPHILKSFDAELEQLRIDLIQMGNLVSRAVDSAVNGLMESDIERCSDVIADDEIVDQQEKAIDSKGMSILLMYNPVASDFRMAISTLSVCRALERIGDHAVNISKGARKILKRDGASAEVRMVEPLFEATRNLLAQALMAYADSDGEKALEVIAGDKEVDKLHRRFSKHLTSLVGDGNGNAECNVHLLFISRSLERIGDLASNIAEDVVFISSAEDVRHM